MQARSSSDCNPVTCFCHSEIDNLKQSKCDLWEKMDKLTIKYDAKYDAILMRTNVILGGIAVSCILLVVNILIKYHP
jgi:hypothetical protein